MESKISKKVLVDVLPVFNKIVAKCSPITTFSSIQIVCKNGNMHFRVYNIESIEFDAEVESDGDFTAIVNFSQFNTAVRACKGKFITIKYTEGSDKLYIDDAGIAVIPQDRCDFPEQMAVSDDAEEITLPKNFIDALKKSILVISKDETRKVLRGVNINEYGVVSTNGKELFHTIMNFNIKKQFTIPAPNAIAQMKSPYTEGKLYYWSVGASKAPAEQAVGVNGESFHEFFKFVFGNITWSGKCLAGIFPPWQRIIPNKTNAVCSVKFTNEEAEEIKDWLKLLAKLNPKDSTNCIEFTKKEEGLYFKAWDNSEKVIKTDSTDSWGDNVFRTTKQHLEHFLSMGCLDFYYLGPDTPCIAIGDWCEYVSMPLRVRQAGM